MRFETKSIIVEFLIIIALIVLAVVSSRCAEQAKYGYTCYEVVSPNGTIGVNDGWYLKIGEVGEDYKEYSRAKDRKDCLKKGEKWMKSYEKKLRKDMNNRKPAERKREGKTTRTSCSRISGLLPRPLLYFQRMI